MGRHSLTRLALMFTLLLPLAALAHTGSGHVAGFGAGFLHPFLGWDHLLAMVAVGIWAAQLGGRMAWLLPVTFILALLLGATLGAGGMALPYIEMGILLSVLALGALISLALKPHALPGVALVALFALAHGHAHGTEIPVALDGIGYGAGMALGTALLMAAGFSLIRSLCHWQLDRLVPYSGMTILAGGLLLAVG